MNLLMFVYYRLTFPDAFRKRDRLTNGGETGNTMFNYDDVSIVIMFIALCGTPELSFVL